MIAISDQQQNVSLTYAYDPFGREVASAEQANAENRFRFLGQYGGYTEFDGLVFLNRRFYVADLGRFLTRDPAGSDFDFTQLLNLYPYASNNPVNFIDPTGLSAMRDTALRVSSQQGSSDQVHEPLVNRRNRSSSSVFATIGNFLLEGGKVVAKIFYADETLEIVGAVEVVEVAFKVKKVIDIGGDLRNPDFIVQDVEERYQKSQFNRNRVDDLARGSYGLPWTQLSYEQKRSLTDARTAPDGITVQGVLGGGFHSGYYSPTFGREFIKR